MHGYHSYTFGFLSGELIRRVDPQRRSCGQFIRDEIDKDFHFGITDETIERRVALLIRSVRFHSDLPYRRDLSSSNLSFSHHPHPPVPPPDELRQDSMTCNGALALQLEDKYDMVFNRVEIHRVEIPAANGITNALSLARIYASAMGDVDETDEKRSRLFSKRTLQRATTSATPDGERDRILYGRRTNFAQGGFQLHGEGFAVIGSRCFWSYR